jgi:hypothetical protein
MGLMDVLNGMQNGPRGQRDPSSGSGGMSPITMAILGLLAYKAVKGFTGSQQSTTPSSTRVPPGETLSMPTCRAAGWAICSEAGWAVCSQPVPLEAS